MHHPQTFGGIAAQNAAGSVPPRGGEVVEGLTALNNNIDVLEGSAVRLTDRLMPVVRPAALGTTAEDPRPEPLSPFAQELRRLYRRIDYLGDLIADTDLRLELP